MSTHPVVSCTSPFTIRPCSRFPRAGVRRRAGASIITIWTSYRTRLQFDTGRDHTIISDQDNAIEIAQALTHFLREETNEAIRNIIRQAGAGR